MGNSVMFLKGFSDSSFFDTYEKKIESIIPEGYKLTEWGEPVGGFFWNLQKETPEYELWDVHCHLHKIGDNEHDYVLHYPSGKMTVSPCTDAVGYHNVNDPNFLCLSCGSFHRLIDGKIWYFDEYCKAEGDNFNIVTSIDGIPRDLQEEFRKFFTQHPKGKVRITIDEDYKREKVEYFE